MKRGGKEGTPSLKYAEFMTARLRGVCVFLSSLLCLSSCVKQGAPDSGTAAGALVAGRNVFSVTDDEGNTVSFDKPFTRIISFYSAHTENLFALGA
ncbi:MAG: hypothetical protein LBJ86_07530, partial [Spirochaetaceae bacterium]|nr:hypothetical protein [Spirochaetaceae bacterium]